MSLNYKAAKNQKKNELDADPFPSHPSKLM